MPVCLSQDDDNVNYNYCPSFGAAVLFSVLYSITTGAHIYQAIKYRKPFCWVICMAATWETMGYILRSVSVYHQGAFGIFLAQFLFVLLAPIWINAFVYMIMGRMILYFVPEQKVMRVMAKRLTVIFVWLDIISFIIQALGGSIIGGSGSSVQTGLDIYRGGIGLQEAFILVFFVLAIQFHRRMNYVENTRATNWRMQLYVEYAVLSLITVRVIYRLAEYANGVDSYAPDHEWVFYVFDTLPMLFALILLNAFHPGRFLLGPESEFPKYTRAEKKAMKQQKKAEKAAKKAAKKEEKLAKKEGPLLPAASPIISPNDPYRVTRDGTVELEERTKTPSTLMPGYV